MNKIGLRILYFWIAYNTKHSMRKKSINIYNSMRYKKIWGAGVAYINELVAIIKNDNTRI
jgi:hypothetical protein